MENKRIEYIDVAKAFGIGLVILGHIHISQSLHNWIYTFHMPLFFVLSGMTFRIESFKVFIKKRLFSILLPYVLFSVLMIIKNMAKVLMNGNSDGILLLKTEILAVLFAVQNGKYSAGIYWFLPCLFVVEIFLYVLIKVCRNNLTTVFICSAVISFVQYLLDCRFNYSLPFCSDVALVAIIFVAFGYTTKDWFYRFSQKDNKILKSGCVFASLALGIATVIVNTRYVGKGLEMSVGAYGNYGFMFVGAISLTVFVILISQFCHGKALNYIGRNTLFIYLFHPFLIHESVIRLAENAVFGLVNNKMIAQMIVTAVMWATIMIVSVIFSFAYNKVMNKLKNCFFKQK